MVSLQLIIKRAFDIAASLVILVIFFPIGLMISLIIKLDSEGPVFFLQERPGKGTQIFKVYKFRTMRPGSEKMIKGKEVFVDDDRVTKIGKFLRRYKIDELPQLLNVIKGEMSLVGPRPERMDYLGEYTQEELKRFNMRPGLTGLAQVSGNIHISLDERHMKDVYYVDNFSLIMDIKIMLLTVGVVLFGEDKFAKEEGKANS
ncbi:MAG: sugar transferase [Paeniclostridium sordellii]|uniref:Sugar transferase n=1 Tax=Paeniclostridium hominis TaxID=2764329 RepID=A0ABR7K3Y3_9FIRM|nr:MULTISPECIES: sugar transferase [Paeniclostridium]MBC6003817.1 sugar transferase [Paeniclostridium hominis]MDU2592527.1 sugar transferase [Paeniclostridium sordellii]